MPWPRRQKITELELKHQFDTLQLQLVRLREQLTNKERYAAKLELLLRERLTRIDELNATIDRLREQNRRMTAERTQAQSQA